MARTYQHDYDAAVGAFEAAARIQPHDVNTLQVPRGGTSDMRECVVCRESEATLQQLVASQPGRASRHPAMRSCCESER